MIKDHEHYMRLAIKEAINAGERGEVPIGAILVINEQIISKSSNQVELLKDSTAHAEIIALTGAYATLGAKYLPDATLYVTIEPCIMCAGALFWGKIGTVVFGAHDEKNGYSRFDKQSGNHKISPLHPKTTVISGVCKEECLSLIQNFFRNKR